MVLFTKNPATGNLTRFGIFASVKPENRTVQLDKAAEQCGIVIEKKHYFNVSVNPETNDAVLERIADRICHLVRKEGIRVVALRYLNIRTLPRILTAAGLHLPDDVVILSVSPMPFERESGCVQIVYDWEKLMETAVDVLLRTIEKPDRICGKYLVPCQTVSGPLLTENANRKDIR